jgi:photosystem II stability/assembly factor-like uncharacterized protein
MVRLNAFAFVTLFSVLDSGAASSWVNLNNNQSIGSFFGVAGTSSETVAVGIDGRISTRNNLTGNWSIQTFSGNPDFRDVIYANGNYITVREGGEIRTSLDGLTWNLQTSGVTTDLRSILWDGSNFLVGGQNGTILRSSNGISWQQVSNSGPFINALAFSGSKYIAAGGYGLKISSDGISWRNVLTPPSSYSWEAATWTGSKFYVGGLFGSGVWESLDGDTWAKSSDGNFSWNIESMVTVGGKTWMVGDNTYVFSKTNDGNWIEEYLVKKGSEFFMDVNYSGNNLIVAGFNNNVLSTVIPEPSAVSLIAIGLSGLAMMRRRRS